MLTLLKNYDYESFAEVWEGRNDTAKDALRKCLKVCFYLIHDVWRVSDSVIAKHINEVQVPEGVKARKLKADQVAPLVAIALSGRDLAERKNDKDGLKHTEYFRANSQPTAVDVWRLMRAMQQIVRDGERPLSLLEANSDDRRTYVKELLEPKRGNKGETDINTARLERLKKTKGSQFELVRGIMDGVIENVQITVGNDASKFVNFNDEDVLGFSMVIQRLIEREAELFLLAKGDQGEAFSLLDHLGSRIESTDAERLVRYPQLLQAAVNLLNENDGESEALMKMLTRVEVA